MKIECLVLEEGEREVTFNGSTRKSYELSLRDFCKSGARCKSNFRYELKGAELDKYRGKLRDQMVTVVVSDIAAPYNGVFPLVGVLEVAPAVAQGKN